MKKDQVFLSLMISLVFLSMALAGCAKTKTTVSTTGPAQSSPATTMSATPTQSLPPLLVISVSGPLSPINPGGPVVEITLKNVSSKTIYAVTAALTLNRPFDFNFDVSAARPLAPNSSISTKQTLISGSINDSTNYDLKISGNYQDGGTFSFDQTVKIAIPPATTAPAVFDQKSSSTEFANGMSLNLAINSTSYHPGDQVSISIEEKNSLAVQNNLPAADFWIVPGLTVGPCGTLNYPFGVAVLKGNYDLTSVLSASPLTLFDPTATYNCPAILAGITAYNFQPASNLAAILTRDASPAISISMTAQVKATGFWSGSPKAVLSNFEPGVYTVLAGDEWGNAAVLHFVVN